MRALGIATTGMLAQQRNVEVVSNNLANMNTTGFMRRRTEFHDLLYQNLRRVGSTASDAETDSDRQTRHISVADAITHFQDLPSSNISGFAPKPFP